MSNGHPERRSFSELNDDIEKISDLIKNKTMEQIVSSTVKLKEAGEKAYRAGEKSNRTAELDSAYVLLGRYMNILTKMQHRPDYNKYKDLIRKKLGNNEEQLRLMMLLEKVKVKVLSDEGRKCAAEKDSSIGVLPLPPLPPQSQPTIQEADMIADVQKHRSTIDCASLMEMMSKDSKRCLIIDCRPEAEYVESRIDFQFAFNIPEHLCIIGMSITKLQQQLPNESKVYWNMRKDRSIIIFVDLFSTSFIRNSPPWHLRNLINEYDQEVEKKPEMLLLEGGYERFVLLYPTKCMNPHAVKPRIVDDSTPSIGEIEYPNLDDIVMKDQSSGNISGGGGTPSIDRSTKSNALKSYEKNLSTSELLEKKQELLNKSLINENQLMKLEQDYNEVSFNKENEEDLTKETQLRYQIMELDTKQKDIALEQEGINSVLKIKDKSFEQNNAMSKVENLELVLAKQKAEREHKRREQEALKIARENRKPTHDGHPAKAPRTSSNELILSPRALNQNVIPHFDRASKPVHQVIPQSYYDKQDFAPVYQKVERGLTGLKNLGNTCYMNSIIQCLSHTLTLTQFLLENDYEKQINRSNRTKGHIVKTLAAVIKMLWNGECKYISSKFLKGVIGDQDNLFSGMDQQDSHEFLVMLIDWLQSDLQTISMPNYGVENLQASEKAWHEYTKAKESFILRLFYGQIKSTVKCTVCEEESATFETFSNLSLELPMYNVDRYDITECFNLYFHGERISGWNCPRCKGPRDAIKKLDISKLPPVLVIHLKRFFADGFSFRKKQAYVDFPLDGLNMLQYVAPNEKRFHLANYKYNLYAVSNHYGTMESGHYTAFCRNAKQKKWYKFDDHCVNPLDRSDVVSSAAYILFYTHVQDTLFN